MRPAFSRLWARIRSVLGSVATSKSTIIRHLTVGRGVQRIHVVHVVDAAHLLLDGSGDRLLDGLRVRAHVDRLEPELRAGRCRETAPPAGSR